MLSKKLGLIAGDGELPVKLVKSAKNMGFSTVAISLAPGNRNQLNKYCEKIYSFGPGEIQKIINTLHKEEIKQLSFIGKVHKGLLLRNPKLDARAIKLLKQRKRLNDDQIMLTVIEELEAENISVLDQTLFIKDLLVDKGVLSELKPTDENMADIEYGFQIAKQMGKVDIGQSVIVENKMILAVEAIEGTDRAIERGCKLSSGKAIVVKVSKPNQDCRFDIPTVGVNTLKTMKKFGGKVLAIEANETFIVEKDEMIKFANKNNMVIVSA